MQSIEIGQPRVEGEHNFMILSLGQSLAVGDVYLTLHQLLSLEPFACKALDSRLSGHFGPDRNSALPAIYKLFTNKWEKGEVETGSIGKIQLDMNNYQREELQKDYHISLERTDYGIKIDALYNKLSLDSSFDAFSNSPEREDTITIHVINKSQEGLFQALNFEPYTMMHIDQKQFDMLEYLIANLSVK